MSSRKNKLKNPITGALKDEQTKRTLRDLDASVRDAITAVLAGYYASPDTLRDMVQSEFARSIRYSLGSSGAPSEAALYKEVMRKARELAVAEFNSPEQQEKMVQLLKEQYLHSIREGLLRDVAERAKRDAYELYRRVLEGR